MDADGAWLGRDEEEVHPGGLVRQFRIGLDGLLEEKP
jgi:hypothetical protein